MNDSPLSPPLLQLDHRALDSLRTGPFALAQPRWPGPCVTVCCWIRVTDPGPIQVIANHGHRHAREAGWSLYLDDDAVMASLRVGRRSQAIAAPLPQDDRWHHLVATFDHDAVTADGWLDGAGSPWRATPPRLTLIGEPAAQTGLVIGGYTDAAGGHFNFTFGRRAQDRLDDLRLYDRRLTQDELDAFIPEDAPPPTAAFTMQPECPDAPTAVRFHAFPSTPLRTSPSTALRTSPSVRAYWWDFGDGAQTEGATAEHAYACAGRYTVRLTVLDEHHAQTEAEQTLTLGGPEPPVRFSPVFVNGEAGYAAFRIPSIVVATNGDLVAFAEGRLESVSDSTRTIRIVCKRSTDQGASWGPLQVVGRAWFDGEEYAAMYPAPVVDSVRGTGRIVLVYLQTRGSEWELVQGQGALRVACTASDDHGLVWREPSDITDQVHRPHAWRIQRPTAGHAIQLRGTRDRPAICGRLFYIGSHTQGGDSVFDQWNYAFWSDDLGATWQIGPAIERRADSASAQGLNEATAVEMSDGRVLINSRNYRDGRPVGCRALTVGEFDASGRLRFGPARHADTLIEPPAQASMVRATGPDPAAPGCLLFANPAHSSARVNLTVRASFDDGETWPVARTINAGPSAYSDLVVQSEGAVGVLYERGNDGGIHYANFDLDWLIAE